jgi:protein O-GlcNAc transferase
MKNRSADPTITFRTALNHFQKKRFVQARKLLLEVSKTSPKKIDVRRLLGAVCSEMNRHDEAVTHFLKVVELAPLPLDYFNLGKAFQLAGNFDKALQAHEAGLAQTPSDPRLLQGRALTLTQLGRINDSIAVYQDLLRISPDFVEAYSNFGETLLVAGRSAEALNHFQRAIQLEPNSSHTLSGLIRAKLNLCDWSKFDELAQKLNSLSEAGRNAYPFTVLTISDKPEVHLAAARAKAGVNGGSHQSMQFSPTDFLSSGNKIRVAYISADFRSHPISFLIAGLLEAHDRTNFEIIAVSTGNDDGSEIRERIVRGVDRFVDVSGLSVPDSAARIRQLDVHIALDLMGYTKDSIDIAFQSRLAPIQVNFQGYPGTTAIDAMDYIVVDRYIATERVCRNFTEKPVILPHCYQPNDPKRPRPEHAQPRGKYGLPESGFVFCCFNNTGKITPDMFRVWMRILAAVDGSVLWLSVPNAVAQANLRVEAGRHGISPQRLVFADRLPSHEQHLSRYLVADLFLDTFPYGAHATGSDALWMGCPLVALTGESFPARVAGSLLHTVGLPELIATTVEDYERLAIKIAQEPSAVASYRRRLNDCRRTTPLFDAALFARNLEVAFVEMCQRFQRGRQPRAIIVPDSGIRQT